MFDVDVLDTDDEELSVVRRVNRRELPARIAALDLGSNSFHLVVAEVRDQQFEIVARSKERVQLGASVFSAGRIEDEAFARGLSAVRRLREIAAEWVPQTSIAVATSAIREAENGREFARAAQRAAGFPIHVIDGLEEARLVCVGARREVGLPGGRMALFDVGGGSTEALVADDSKCALTASLPLGTLRLRQRWQGSELPSATELATLRAMAIETLEPTLRHVAQVGFQRVVFSCGTARSLLRLHTGEGFEPGGIPSMLLPATRELPRAGIEALIQRLSTLRPAERELIARVGDRGVDTLLVGGMILSVILERLGSERAFIVQSGLREGLIVDHLERGRTRAALPLAT